MLRFKIFYCSTNYFLTYSVNALAVYLCDRLRTVAVVDYGI